MKKIAKFLSMILLCFASAFAFFACQDESNTVKVKEIVLNKHEITLYVGGDTSSEEELEVSFKPANATQKDVEFFSYDTSLIEITPKEDSEYKFIVKVKNPEANNSQTFVSVRMKGNADVRDKCVVKIKKLEQRMLTPTGLKFNYQTQAIEWDASTETIDQGFNGYMLKINGQEIVCPVLNSYKKFTKGEKLTVQVKAISHVSELDSNYSDEYVFMVLENIESLTHANGIVSWSSVKDAVNYEYKVNADNAIMLPSSELSQSQVFNESGEYQITVTAKTPSETISTEGEICYCFDSAPKTIVITKLSTPANLQYKRFFSWSPVVMDNGTVPVCYEVYEVLSNTEKLVYKGTDVSYAVPSDLAVGNHTYKVRAVGDNEKVITSEFTGIITVNKLTSPTGLRVEDGKITWDRQSDAVSYNLTFNGLYDGRKYFNDDEYTFNVSQPQGDQTKVQFAMNEKFEGGYKIKIASVSDALNTITSNYTEELVVKKLATPENNSFSVSNGKIIMPLQNNASAYEVQLVVGSQRLNLSLHTNEIEIPSSLKEGEVSLRIRYIGTESASTGDLYLTSDYSSMVYAKKLSSPTLSVSDGELKWTNIDYSTNYILTITSGNNTKSYNVGKLQSFDFYGIDEAIFGQGTTFPAGNYQVSIQALAGNPSGKYFGFFDSQVSSEMQITKRQAPIISVVDGEVKISMPDGGSNYNVRYKIENDGSLTYFGYALGDNESVIRSDDAVTLNAKKAPSSYNIKMENGVLSWDELAEEYQGASFLIGLDSSNEDSKFDYKSYGINHSYDFNNRQDYPAGNYTFKIKVAGTSGNAGDSNIILNSDTEQTFSFVILPVVEPSVQGALQAVTSGDISEDNLPGVLIWDEATISGKNALGYNIVISQNGTEVLRQDTKNIRKYDLGTLPAGNYEVKIQAYGNGKDIVSSDYSEEKTFTKLDTAKNIKIEKDGTISWTSSYTNGVMNTKVMFVLVVNGNFVNMYDFDKVVSGSGLDMAGLLSELKRTSVNIDKLTSFDDTSKYLYFTKGSYNVKIITLPLNLEGTSKDLISNYSETLSFTRLEQPYGLTINRNENGEYVVSWTKSNNTENIKGYRLTIKNDETKDIETEDIVGADVTTYNLTNYIKAKLGDSDAMASYTIDLMTLSNTDNVIDSERTATVSVKVLPNINISIVDGKLRWTKIDGAEKYIFTFTRGDESFDIDMPANSTEYAMTLENDLRFVSGTYLIKVKVIGNESSSYGTKICLDSLNVKDQGEFKKLATPTDIKVRSGKIVFEWDKTLVTSENVKYFFNMLITGKTQKTLKINKDQIVELGSEFASGTYQIRVQAMGDNEFINSEVSAYISPKDVIKLDKTTVFVDKGILNWKVNNNANGYLVSISGVNFYVYDENNELVEDGATKEYEVSVSGQTSIDLSSDITTTTGKKIKLATGEYSVQIKCIGTNKTYLNSDFTDIVRVRKLATVQNVRVENGKISWDKVASADAPNGLLLFIKLPNRAEYEKAILLSNTETSYDFTNTDKYVYPAGQGYFAYLQTNGDTSLSGAVSSVKISGTPSEVLENFEKLPVPTNPKVVYSSEADYLGNFTFDKLPSNYADVKYFVKLKVISGEKFIEKEFTLDDNIFSIPKNIADGLVDMEEGTQIEFMVKYLGQGNYLDSEFTSKLTIIIPTTPDLTVIVDEKERFTGKVEWNKVTIGDLLTNYVFKYQFISAESVPSISSVDEITEEMWNAVTPTEVQTTNLYAYINGKGYYRFKVMSVLIIEGEDGTSSQIKSNEKDYTKGYDFCLFSSGNGTEKTPFIVDSAETFNFINYNPTAHYALSPDENFKGIDFGGYVVQNIGTKDEMFTGSFNGNNKYLINITLTDVAENSSIFDYVGENGIIKDVVIQNFLISSGSNVGAIVGFNKGTVENIIVGAIVDDETGNYIYDGVSQIRSYSLNSSITYAGGIVGYNEGIITECQNYAVICSKNDNAQVRSGGIAGYNKGTISYCLNYGTVGGENKTSINSNMSGGIVGFNETGTITYCGNYANVYASARNSNNVSQSAYVGGICAYDQAGKITYCYNDNSNGVYTTDGILAQTEIYGVTTFSQRSVYVGGLVGYNEKTSTIVDCYTISNVQYSTSGTSATVEAGAVMGKNFIINTDRFKNVYYLIMDESGVTSACRDLPKIPQNITGYTPATIDSFKQVLKNKYNIDL